MAESTVKKQVFVGYIISLVNERELLLPEHAKTPPVPLYLTVDRWYTHGPPKVSVTPFERFATLILNAQDMAAVVDAFIQPLGRSDGPVFNQPVFTVTPVYEDE